VTERGAGPGGVIRVDLSLCQGHGRCYGAAPELFRPMDDDGHSEFFASPIDPADEESIEAGELAIGTCPELALSWDRGVDGRSDT
jgi:ferredoxin